MSYDPAEHTIDEVRQYLADNPDQTADVLAAEQARGDEARSTLVTSLQNGTTQYKQGEGPESFEGDEPVDLTKGFPDGEYPDEGITGYIVAEPTQAE